MTTENDNRKAFLSMSRNQMESVCLTLQGAALQARASNGLIDDMLGGFGPMLKGLGLDLSEAMSDPGKPFEVTAAVMREWYNSVNGEE